MIIRALLLLVILAGGLCAQDFSAPLPEVPEESFGPPPKPEFFGEKQARDGIVVRILRTLNPARLFDPRAPAEHGTGEDTVSRDPNDPKRKPRGFILFSINW